MDDLEELKKDIEKLKKNLDKLIESKEENLLDPDVLSSSQILNTAIVQYNKILLERLKNK